MSPTDELRCPVCGVGVVQDLGFDADARADDGRPVQAARGARVDPILLRTPGPGIPPRDRRSRTAGRRAALVRRHDRDAGALGHVVVAVVRVVGPAGRIVPDPHGGFLGRWTPSTWGASSPISSGSSSGSSSSINASNRFGSPRSLRSRTRASRASASSSESPSTCSVAVVRPSIPSGRSSDSIRSSSCSCGSSASSQSLIAPSSLSLQLTSSRYGLS